MKYLAWMMVPLLVSCGTNTRVQTEPTVIDSSCSWAKVILIGKQDVLTDATARQLIAHNRLVEKNCPNK